MKQIFSFVFLALFLAACIGSTTNSGVVGADRMQLFLVSSDEMNEGANLAYAQTMKEAGSQKALNTNSAQTKRVRKIAENLIAHVGVFRKDALKWDWQVNVISSDTLNAWCMPGGKIAVYTGIIERLKLTDAELAAIMGHEIAHALREHSRERASTDKLKGLGLFALSQAANLGETSLQLANLASHYAISLPFSRSHETEADHMGTELMARAGYDPMAAVNVWKKMQKISQESTMEILSTHPSNESRIKDLTDIAKKVEHLYKAAKKG